MKEEGIEDTGITSLMINFIQNNTCSKRKVLNDKERLFNQLLFNTVITKSF